MMLTQNFRRRNVAYARYHRALWVLVLFPATVWREVQHPCLLGAACTAVVVLACAMAGWMYREAIRWWTETPVPDN